MRTCALTQRNYPQDWGSKSTSDEDEDLEEIDELAKEEDDDDDGLSESPEQDKSESESETVNGVPPTPVEWCTYAGYDDLQ